MRILPCDLIKCTCDGSVYNKTCVKWPLSKRPKVGFQDRLSLNAGQKYCRMLLIFIKLSFVIKIFVLSFFEKPFCTGFTIHIKWSLAKTQDYPMAAIFFVCLVTLRPKSTAMVMAERSVHLTTLFPGQA